MGIYTDASKRFSVETPEGVIAFFRLVSAEVHRYVSRLTGGDRQLTEDIVQEAFLALVRQSRGGLLVEVERGWIMTTARNRFIDHVRSSNREDRRLDAYKCTIGDGAIRGWRETERAACRRTGQPNCSPRFRRLSVGPCRCRSSMS